MKIAGKFVFSNFLHLHFLHIHIDADMCVRVMHQPDNLIKRTMTFSEWEELEKGKLNFHSRQDDFRVCIESAARCLRQKFVFTHACVYLRAIL